MEKLESDLGQVEEFEVISRKAIAFGAATPLADLSTGSRPWREALENGRGILFLVDGLDEALQREQPILNSLVELLKTEPLDRVRFILTCRSAHWLPETGQELASLWGHRGKDFVFELCPLRHVDAELAARKEFGDRAKEFFDELVRCEAAPLARWPITLDMLIGEFRDSGGFPTSRGELYRSAIQRLVDEPNPTRERILGSNDPDWLPGEKLHLARRIAAMMLFGGKKAYLRCAHSSDPECLTRSDVLGDDGNLELPSGASVPITTRKIDRLVDTRIFETTTVGGSGSTQALRFAHRSFAELLAGEFVAGLRPDELRRLFFVPQPSGEERIVPQLLQTAAWLAGSAENPKFFELLLSQHPEALLDADLSPFSDADKRRIVERLLEKAVTGDPGPDRAVSRASYPLRFPGIDALLRPVILDSTANLHARRFAFDLARTCRVPELANAIWEILDRPDDSLEHEAAHALRVIEDDPMPHRSKLEKLASGERGGDGSDTLKGVALQLLVPRCLAVREILGWLSPPKLEFYGGSYQSFLNWSLPKAVTDQDLPDCLGFLRTKPDCFDSLSPYGDFANQVFDLACENLHCPEIADLLVRLWLEKAREYHPLPHESHAAPSKNTFGNESNAKRFVECFLNHPEVEPDDRWHLHENVTGLSLEFLLDRLPFAPRDRRSNWAAAIRYAAKPEEREEHRQVLQERYDDYPEVRAVFPPIRKSGLDMHDTLLRFEKAGELKLKQRQRKNRAKLRRIRKQHPTGDDIFNGGLEQCRKGELVGWINISHGIVRDANMKFSVGANIETSKLFQGLSEEDQAAVRDCARGFLLEFDDDGHTGERRTNFSESAYWAISWLRADFDNGPELRRAVSDKWIGAIIDAFNNGEEEQQELVTLAYRWNPTETRRWLRIQLERRLTSDGEGWLLDLRAFESTWDRQLSEDLADFLATPDLKPGSKRDGLLHLLKLDPEFAAGVISGHLEAIKAADPNLGQDTHRAVVAVTWFFADSAQKDNAWPLIAGNADSAKLLLLENVPEFETRNETWLQFEESRHVSNLLHLVFQLFPPDEDPPLNHSSAVTSTDECIRLRRDLFQLLVKHGETVKIERFLDTLPSAEADLYRWNLDEAKQHRALLDWVPQRPEEILRLVRIADGSLIRHGDDLLEVVLASLARFQDRLQSHHLHRVWAGDTPGREEYVSKEIVDWLTTDLPQVVVNREVEVNRWNDRVDIKIEALSPQATDEPPITLIIEVKRAHNREIPDSIRTQLIDQYLVPKRDAGWKHGIYLVAWFRSRGKWDEKQYLKSKTPSAAAKELARHCAKAEKTSATRIAPFLLDCSNPVRNPKRSSRKQVAKKTAKG